jgi:hypothetical protein
MNFGFVRLCRGAQLKQWKHLRVRYVGSGWIPFGFMVLLYLALSSSQGYESVVVLWLIHGEWVVAMSPVFVEEHLIQEH